MIPFKKIAVIGGGPAGLFAAEIIASAGHKVTIYDRMPTPARKLLIAGRGGLNLTHSEELEKFITRYDKAANWIKPYIKNFAPDDLRKWCEELGHKTFIGSSGRIFPNEMKAAGLLRSWLKRLDSMNVKYAARHYWHGWENGMLKFTNEKTENILVKVDAVLLALGGASWAKLGSDGSWINILQKEGVKINALKPANCGFITNWSEYFSGRFAGTPLKSIGVTLNAVSHKGEGMITKNGIEGGVIYALSSTTRNEIEANGSAVLKLDLRPDMSETELTKKLGKRGDNSFSNYMRKNGFAPVAVSLLRENLSDLNKLSATELAARIKAVEITATATSSITRAISSAGGIELTELDENLMLKSKPGVFAAGEMLDWEAPTGGYLLQGCFSTAYTAANGILKFIA